MCIFFLHSLFFVTFGVIIAGAYRSEIEEKDADIASLQKQLNDSMQRERKLRDKVALAEARAEQGLWSLDSFDAAVSMNMILCHCKVYHTFLVPFR